MYFLFVFLKDFCPEKYKSLCKIMSSKFIKTGDASTMLESYLSVITKGSCSNDDSGLFLAKDFEPRMSYVASPISGKFMIEKCSHFKFKGTCMQHNFRRFIRNCDFPLTLYIVACPRKCNVISMNFVELQTV